MSPRKSQLDELQLEESEPNAFTSPNHNHAFGSPSNHHDNAGLHHFSDDLLDNINPFDADLIDDDASVSACEEQQTVFGHEQEDASESKADKRGAYESGDDGSDDSYGKQVLEEKAKRKRRKEKERLRDEEAMASAEPAATTTRQPSGTSRSARGESGAPGPPRPQKPPKAQDSGRPIAKNRDVTTGFDSSPPTDSSSEEDETADRVGNIAGKGKGKRRAGGRPPAEALARCDALGESTRAEALAIAEEYHLHPQTVLVRAGLALKATKVKNVSNAVRKVFAHEYRLQHNGGMSAKRASLFHNIERASDNAPDGAAEAYYQTWKAEYGNSHEARQSQLKAAHAIDDEAALDGVTVNQLRAQALTISKQITQLVRLPYHFIYLMLILFPGQDIL